MNDTPTTSGNLIYSKDARLSSAIMLLRDFAARCGGALLRLPKEPDCLEGVCTEPGYYPNCQIRIGRGRGVYTCDTIQIAEDEMACPFNGEGLSVRHPSDEWPTWVWHRCPSVRAVPVWAVPIIRDRLETLKRRMEERKRHNAVIAALVEDGDAPF
jgi:hypothetical protein